MSSYQEKRLQIVSASGMGNALLPSDRDKIVALDKAMRAGLSEFLSPHEVDEYLLRDSDAASQLKWALGAARPTESEYRTLFPLFQSYVDQFPTATFRRNPNAPIDSAQKMAEESMIAQLGAALGQQKAEELRLALDPKYAGVNQLVNRLNLPISVGKQVYDVQQNIQSRAATVRNDHTLTAGDRANQLTALATEASTKILSALGGPRGLEAYRQYGGQWMSTLTPTPPPKG